MNWLRAPLLLLLLSILTGLIYPLFITALGQWLFADRANGSLLREKGKIVGSRFIGQAFKNEKYFWPRPSAIQYQPLPSGASNLSRANPKLIEEVKSRHRFWLQTHGGNETTSVPPDLLYASASGLDPHISLQGALFQLDRIAKARQWDDAEKKRALHLLDSHVEHSSVTFPGETGVNVLLLNLSLDRIFP